MQLKVSFYFQTFIARISTDGGP